MIDSFSVKKTCMTKKEYDELEMRINDLLDYYIKMNGEADLPDLEEMTLDSLIYYYVTFCAVWYYWLFEIIDYNENYELCAKIDRMINYERQNVINCAHDLLLYNDQTDEKQFLEFLNISKEESYKLQLLNKDAH